MIKTFSKFYYGFEITEDNCSIDFAEGGSELTATVPVGSYTATEICTAIADSMTAVGALTYSVSFDRSSRLVTIEASGNYSLLLGTGTHRDASPFELIGFTQGTDRTGDDTYTGATAAGDVYSPQYMLQDFVDADNFEEAIDATVNESANGEIQVVKFGSRAFFEFNILFATNYIQRADSPIRNNPTGEADLRRFMRFLVTKAPVEFMPDENDPDTFENLLLESTVENQKGVGYRLKEMYDKNAVGYFQTQKLKFRVVE